MCHIGYFWKSLGENGSWILEKYCYNWNQLPQICPFAKFCEKNKTPKFDAENVSFRYFGASSWKQHICHIWNPHP